jgi:hypothetical protein
MAMVDDQQHKSRLSRGYPLEAACRLIHTAHRLNRAGRTLETLAPSRHSYFVTVLRTRDRVDGIARLISTATKDLRLAGIDKDRKILAIGEKRLSLQDASRELRQIKAHLDAEAVRTRSGDSQGQGSGGADHPPSADGLTEYANNAAKTGGAISGWIALGYVVGGWLADLFNGVGDDNARAQIENASPDQIRQIADTELVNLVNAMLDGFTGDDDERCILRIFDALDCQRLSDVVARVGIGALLSAIDGDEWDRLVNRLADCGIIGVDKMDDDASRAFVRNRSDAQLAQLPLSTVRQLILNMFSGSCGDDDEDSILRLLNCQTGARIHQLIAMPGTEVGAFDYNFDGDQWDDLEMLFASHGINLDT